MDSKELEQRLKQIIVENLGCKEYEIKPESRFIEDLGADSLDMVELEMACEQEFHVDLDLYDEPDYSRIATFEKALKHLEEKLN